MRTAILLFAGTALAFADGPGRIASQRARAEFALTADPEAPHWKGVKGQWSENSPTGQPTPANRFETRSRWTGEHLYFLFVCPYQELTLKPDPSTTRETNKLWEWDVAEVFVGADFKNIRQYREYQVSPQGEWVDLDIDRDQPKPEGGWQWNSSFTVKARIDKQNRIWYGEMKIPIASIDARPAKAGNEMRINLYRLAGTNPDRISTAWQPTGQRSHHVPESFGRLVLAE